MPEKDKTEPLDALAEVQRKNDEVLFRLAHELRNPLAPLRNGLHILQMPHADSAARDRAVHLMDQQIQKLTRLVDDLLDVTRLSRGTIQLRKETADLTAIVNQVVATLRPFLEGQQHQLTVTLPRHPVRLEVDPVRLAQVLHHLLHNAAKYTPAAGHIHLAVVREGHEVAVSVRDNGIGIAPEFLPYLFEPFFTRTDGSLARAQGGLGLGLTLVQKFVEMMGGSVSVRSDGPGQGSEFLIRLAALPEASASGAALSGHDSPSPARTPRVLVVEDSEPIAVMLVTLLEMWGHDVCLAADGPAALTLARTYKPDVVLLDIGLPGMSGYEVAQKLRGERRAENLLIVAMTGYDQDDHRRLSFEAGFDHYLVKPIDPNTVKALLKTVTIR